MKTMKHEASTPTVYDGRLCPSEISPEQVQALIREAHRQRSEVIGKGLVHFFRTLASVFRRPGRIIDGSHGRLQPHAH